MSKYNNFQQKHACLNLAKTFSLNLGRKKQEQRLCSCFHLFIVEFE